jgi:cytosine/adenosine deaminase-related metal-dependent hydrolase
MGRAVIETLDLAEWHQRPGHEPPRRRQRLQLRDGHLEHHGPMPAEAPAPQALALPALANAHDHGRGLRTLAFGAEDQALETWMAQLAFEPLVDPYLRAAVAFARMAESGIAAVNHCHNTQDGRALLREAEAVARAARDVGVHVAFAVPFMHRNAVVLGPLEPLLAHLPVADHDRLRQQRHGTRTPAENFALVERIAAFEHDHFHVQYGPVAPQWVDDDTLERIARASAETGRRVHMHLYETAAQRAWCEAHSTGGLLRHLDALGLLSPRLTVAHAVWLDAADCALLATRGVTVSANVSSNLRLRSGQPPWPHYLDNNVRFGLGLDGMSLDDDDDMLRELRLGWHQAKTAAPAQTLGLAHWFDAACVTGRATITDTPASQDVLVLDTRRIAHDRVQPDHPSLLTLALSRATRADVRHLLVNGRTVVRDGHCVTVDRPALEAALLAEARAAWRDHPPDTAAIGRLHHALCCHHTPASVGAASAAIRATPRAHRG